MNRRALLQAVGMTLLAPLAKYLQGPTFYTIPKGGGGCTALHDWETDPSMSIPTRPAWDIGKYRLGPTIGQGGDYSSLASWESAQNETAVFIMPHREPTP